MQRWMVVLLLFGFAWPANAAKTLSIDQMEELLVQLHGKPDGKVASELDEVQLTERVSPARLERWQEEFPGSKARQMLMQLADMSVFLDPPASDVAADPRPDIETQKHILRTAVQYVETTMSRLPDFFATRETTHFEDTLSQHAASSVAEGPVGSATGNVVGGPSAAGVSQPLAAISLTSPGVATSTVFKALHSMGAYSRTVTYRDGREVLEEDSSKPEKEPALGLTTHGEFGPILAQILSDALRSQIGFARWEQGAKGPEAVFHYSVPANASHFKVGITSGGQVASIRPAYHGEIAIDPGTGAILRLSEVAEMTPPYQSMRVAIAVKYAQVTIRGLSYICPVSAVAFSKIPVPTVGAADESAWPVKSELNDVAFTHYHEFRSEVRLLPAPGQGSGDNAAAGSGTPAPENTARVTAPRPTAAAPIGPPQPASENAANGPANAAAVTTAAAPAGNLAAAPSAGAPVMSATSMAAKPETEIAETGAPPPPAGTAPNVPVAGTALDAQSKLKPTLGISTRLVVVDVVVRNGDRPVTGLKQSDFALDEDGAPQSIRYFTPHFVNETTESIAAAAQSARLPPDTWTNLPVANVADSVTVLLLDGLNTAPKDVIYVRREMIRYLKTQPPDQRIAVFALGHRLRMLQSFTTDTSQLLAALEKAEATSPTSLLAPEDQTFQERNELADMAVSGVSPQDIANTQNFMSGAASGQTAMRVNLTLEAMQQLSRYLAGVPGRKNLVWFSSSFPLQFFAVTDVVFNGGSSAQSTPYILPAGTFGRKLKQTTDMLVEARVAVYPVDVRGVLVQPMFTSAQQTDYARQVVGPPMSPAGTGQKEVFGAGQGDAFGADQQMSQRQMVAEHSSMDALAQQTGGRAVYDSNGLQKAMTDALSDGSNFYTLAYVPTNTNYNGAQRNIEVRLRHGKGELFYRRSYYADAGMPSQNEAAQDSRNVFLASIERGVPASSQIVFDVRVAAPDRTPPTGPVAGANSAMKNRAVRYAIDYAAKLDTIGLTPDANGMWQGRLAAVAIAYDRDGNRLNWTENDAPITLDQAARDRLSRSGLQIHQVLDLPAGEVYLRVGLYDPDSSRIGSLEIPLNVATAK
jgi:VWFA-related protein